jgi:hypothetical protein
LRAAAWNTQFDSLHDAARSLLSISGATGQLGAAKIQSATGLQKLREQWYADLYRNVLKGGLYGTDEENPRGSG